MKLLRWLVWGATGIFWIICVVLTHVRELPALPGPDYDKARHYLGYGALAGAWYLSYWIWRPATRWIWLIVLITGAAYGALDEITQPPFGRTCDFFDWLADMGGTLTAVIGMSAIAFVVRRFLTPAPRELVRTSDRG